MDRRERTNDLLSAVLGALQGWQAGLWTAMPGIVQSFDAGAMTAVIQPAIQGVRRHPDGSSELMTMPLLLDCPVMFPGGGGYTLTFPIQAGDEALVIFASRCMDAWWQSGGVQAPLEMRMHDLSDGFVLIGPRSQPRVLSAVSTSAVQLRSDDGETYLEISGNTLNVVAPTSVTVTSPVANLNVANVNINNGNLNVTNGNINLTNGVLAIDGLNFETHRHTGVQTGVGTSGGPVA